MSTPKETSDVALGSHGSSEQSSPAPESDKQTNVHAERYYKLHKFFGFTKGYNFPLFIITVGAMVGFFLYETRALNLDYFLNVRSDDPLYYPLPIVLKSTHAE